MRIIIAFIRPHKIDDVALALRRIPGVTGVSASAARGWGRGKIEAEREHHSDRISDFEEYVRLELCCPMTIAEQVMETIRSAASTGLLGDGKIFLCPLLDAIRIRTGERGEPAL